MAKQTTSPILETLKDGKNIEVGRRLREVRLAKGFSIRSLAEQSKLNVNTINKPDCAAHKDSHPQPACNDYH